MAVTPKKVLRGTLLFLLVMSWMAAAVRGELFAASVIASGDTRLIVLVFALFCAAAFCIGAVGAAVLVLSLLSMLVDAAGDWIDG